MRAARHRRELRCQSCGVSARVVATFLVLGMIALNIRIANESLRQAVHVALVAFLTHADRHNADTDEDEYLTVWQSLFINLVARALPADFYAIDSPERAGELRS